LDLIQGVDELYVSKRKQVTHVNLKKDKPKEETLRELLLGPTGNLRALTFRIGRTLVVGLTKQRIGNCLNDADVQPQSHDFGHESHLGNPGNLGRLCHAERP
jgi:hypothetical protein